MPTMCIQCSMRALLNDKPPPMFDETPEQHRQRMHPDQTATDNERQELEQQLAQKFKEQHNAQS